jgi:hypothetical protein
VDQLPLLAGAYVLATGYLQQIDPVLLQLVEPFIVLTEILCLVLIIRPSFGPRVARPAELAQAAA